MLKFLLPAVIFAARLIPVFASETNYFLVAQPLVGRSWNDSYVLPLSKQEDIDYARYLISRNQLGFLEFDRRIVGVWVAAGSQGINRNYLSPEFPEWSWHVAEFIRFAEGAAEILDGFPTQLEKRFDWQNFGSGRWEIGFFSYTVVRELGPVPLSLSIVPEVQNLQFYWSGVGTNYVYTLEGKDSLASTNWLTLPGASWPRNTNHWTLPLTNGTAQFYRVRAEQTQQ